MKKEKKRLIINLSPVVLGIAASLAAILADGFDAKDIIEESKEAMKNETED